MAKTRSIMASGLSPQSASAIQGGIFSAGGLTASGTTKANALLLPDADNYIAICSSGKAVTLPVSDQGDDCRVYNGGANAVLVFTAAGTSDTITNGSANQGFTVSSFKGAIFEKVTSTLWMVNYSR